MPSDFLSVNTYCQKKSDVVQFGSNKENLSGLRALGKPEDRQIVTVLVSSHKC